MITQAASQQVAVPARAIQTLWAAVAGLSLLVGQAVEAQTDGAPQSFDGAPQSFAELAEKVSPAVVNITTSTQVERNVQGPVVPEGSPFEDFFRDFLDRDGPNGRPDGAPRGPRRSQALGSGFVVSEDGYIVTNNHVIANADEIMVEFFSGNELEAEVVGTDPNTDLALLKVESDEGLPYVPWGDSDEARVGDWVMAMGNPLGQGFSVSAGIVSARGRALSGSYDDYIQTDAAINRGNSGGPLFNMDGEVIGINSAILSPTGGSIGIGFAMSSRVATTVIDQLERFGETRRGWLGVRIQDVTPDIAESIGLETANGALVTDVPEGPAADAGMEAGDVIVSFDGSAVSDTRELVRRVGNAEIGTTVDVTVVRDGDEVDLSVTLGRREEAEGAIPAAAQSSGPVEMETLGLSVSNMTDELREQLGLEPEVEGLVVTDVAEDAEAYEKGLRAGDVISEAGQQKVATVDELTDRIDEAREAGRKSILLLVRREDDPRFVALSLDKG